MKKFATILAVICCLVLISSACFAEGDVASNEAELIKRLREVPEFKFQNHKEGIGEGKAPVYTAPSIDAYRCADGRARCDFSEPIGESNYVDGWLMVRYQISETSMRVGYVQKKYLQGFDFVSHMPKLKMERVPLTAAKDIGITDDPSMDGVAFGVIRKGETFYVLMKYTYTGNWWYVECEIEGKQARGFIDRNNAMVYIGENVTPTEETKVYTLSLIGYPEESPNGEKQIGHVVINPGQRKPVKNKPKKAAKQITVAYPDRYYPCYAVSEKKNGQEWYYIWVETDSKWGWVSSINGTFEALEGLLPLNR
jgi:hypothetical protein